LSILERAPTRTDSTSRSSTLFRPSLTFLLERTVVTLEAARELLSKRHRNLTGLGITQLSISRGIDDNIRLVLLHDGTACVPDVSNLVHDIFRNSKLEEGLGLSSLDLPPFPDSRQTSALCHDPSLLDLSISAGQPTTTFSLQHGGAWRSHLDRGAGDRVLLSRILARQISGTDVADANLITIFDMTPVPTTLRSLSALSL